MKYLVADGYAKPELESAVALAGTDLGTIITSLRERQRVLYLIKDSEHWLELAFWRDRVLVSEQFGKKRMHLRKTLPPEDAQSLALRYTREFVTDSIDWYPSLMEWPGLRFGCPRIFSMLNERFLIKGILGTSIVFGVGALLGGIAIWATLSSGEIWFGPFFVVIGVYAMLLAKRVQFMDRRNKRYGYNSN